MATRLPTLKIDPKSVAALQAAAEKPFYATVGVTDLAVEAVREYVADVQSRVSGYSRDVQRLDLQPRALADGARTVVTTRVAGLQDEARKAPARVQSVVDGNVALLEGAYEGLVKRGESLVGRIRRQKSTQDTVKSAGTTSAKAKTTKTQATKATKAATGTARATAKKATTTAKKRSTAPRSSAKATATAARNTASSATKAAADAASKVGD